MSDRPYFRLGIEQLQAKVSTSRDNIKELKVIQHELGFRDRPKARALKEEVDLRIRQLSERMAIIPSSTDLPFKNIKDTGVQPIEPAHVHLNRVAVECANCHTPNFVSTLDGVTQHLSCSACKTPYEAQFKYGVMRTTFQTQPAKAPSNNAGIWILMGVVALVALIFILK